MQKRLSISDAARELRISYDTMLKRVIRKQIPAIREHGVWTIERRILDQILGWGNPFKTVMAYCRKRGIEPLSFYR